MARSKPKKPYPINSLADANAALAEIGALRRSVTVIETEMNEKIDQAKAEADALAAPLKGRIAEIDAGLLVFAEANKRTIFKGKRSHELDYGTIGYRKSSQIKPKAKHTWAMVLGLLRDMKFPTAIRTKEEVNKEELATWPAERLDLVGARRVEKDQFWYEIDESKIADTAN